VERSCGSQCQCKGSSCYAGLRMVVSGGVEVGIS